MTFESAILIRASPARLFALSQDYGRRLDWDPFLASAELLGDAREPAVGVTARCVARSGFVMDTVYVSYNPPRVAAVRMTRGPWFLAAFAGSWRFEDQEPGLTRVAFRYRLRGRPGWLTALLGPIFARDTRRRLEALRRAVEDGGMGEDPPTPARD